MWFWVIVIGCKGESIALVWVPIVCCRSEFSGLWSWLGDRIGEGWEIDWVGDGSGPTATSWCLCCRSLERESYALFGLKNAWIWNSILGSLVMLLSSKILGSNILATWEISPGECIIGIWLTTLKGFSTTVVVFSAYWFEFSGLEELMILVSVSVMDCNRFIYWFILCWTSTPDSGIWFPSALLLGTICSWITYPGIYVYSSAETVSVPCPWLVLMLTLGSIGTEFL